MCNKGLLGGLVMQIEVRSTRYTRDLINTHMRRKKYTKITLIKINNEDKTKYENNYLTIFYVNQLFIF